jgi:fatty-acid peroxygenase
LTTTTRTRLRHDKAPDATLSLARLGYRFISHKCEQLHSDLFQTRLAMRNTICMRGEDAAKVFYDESRLKRRDATPRPVKMTLLGEGGVQGMDGEAHRWRKQMFLSLMTQEDERQLAELVRAKWTACLPEWERRDRVVLFEEVLEIICRAVCEWSAVPLPESEVKKRTEDLRTMIDGSGSIGWRHLRGRFGRKRAEDWAGGLIEDVREDRLRPPEGSVLHTIAWHRELNGRLLDPKTAAVELLNMLRPTVAIAWYVTFAAVALHQHVEWRERLQAGDGADADELFVQEVRRYYPFFPFVGAEVKQEFDWHGDVFPQGRRVILDLYGTNHHPELWQQPDEFAPERFRHWSGSAFDFIPQGGGDPATGHRCPGEDITIALMKVAVNLLTKSMTYDVPEQDLEIKLNRMPALPRSRFRMTNVRRRSTVLI